MTKHSADDGKDRAWRSPPFRWLFSAFTVSMLGTEITAFVLPLIAALILGAGPAEMGALAAAGKAPTFLLSLASGVAIDRLRRQRTLMIVIDLSRAFLLVIVPVSLALGMLSMPLLYSITFLLGAGSVFHETAQNTYLLAVLPRRRVLDANSKLQVSYSVGEAAGPGLGGVLIQAITAPVAILLTAASQVMSALLLTRVVPDDAAGTGSGTPTRAKGHGPAPPRRRRPTHPVTEAREGLDALLKHRVLGPWAAWGAGSVAFLGAFEAQYLLFATRDLGLDPAAIGLIALLGAAGSLPATFLIRPLTARLPVGKTIVLGLMLSYLALLAIPLATPAHGDLLVLLGLLSVARIVQTLTFTISNVQQWSLRQISTPRALLGRVSAGNRFLIGTAETVGALLGGLLAEALGLHTALLVFAAGGAITLLPLLSRPIWKLIDMPGAETM